MNNFDLNLRLSIIDGLGVFAMESIPPVSDICETPYMDSDCMTVYALLKARKLGPYWHRAMPLKSAVLFPMDPDRMAPIHRLNHSFTPNCIWNREEGALVSIREISKGEELTIDYSATHRQLYMPTFTDVLTGRQVNYAEK